MAASKAQHCNLIAICDWLGAVFVFLDIHDSYELFAQCILRVSNFFWVLGKYIPQTWQVMTLGKKRDCSC